jgi:hypothetical protein
MNYRLLGKSGLRVSEFALATMTLGTDWGWGSAKDEAQKVYNVFPEAGGNFIDTANIERWITSTIEKYKFQFRPLGVKDEAAEIVVAMEVSGTFDGSPVTLDYHFTIESDKISSLTIA